MQAQGAARGLGTTMMPGRGGRLEVVLAIASIVVIVALMTLMVWAGPSGTSGAGTASPNAGFSGSAVIHDDPGNVHRALMPQGAR